MKSTTLQKRTSKLSECTRRFAFCLSLVLMFVTDRVNAAENISVVIGTNASEREKLAADECANQFKRLFDANVSIGTTSSNDHDRIVYLGNSTSHPFIAKYLENGRELSEQGILIKHDSNGDKGSLVICGGSDVATLWAVYELGHRLGIRYLLREDIYPASAKISQLEAIDVVLGPGLKHRSWQMIGDSVLGSESWSLKEHQRLLGQLSKLKFNQILLSIRPWHPFVDYEFGGVKKQTAILWRGEQFPISRDAPGRTGLGSITQFENPDFAGVTAYDEITLRGIEHVKGIIDEAHRLGMTVAVSISPFEFPREFEKVIVGSKPVQGFGGLLVSPGRQQDHDDGALIKLVKTKIRAYINTYPTIDALNLNLPENSPWYADSEIAWTALQERVTSAPEFEELLKQDDSAITPVDRQSEVRSLKSNVIAIMFLSELFQDGELLRRPDGEIVKLSLDGLHPSLEPFVSKLIPNATTNHQVMPLTGDNCGVLSQSATKNIERSLMEFRKNASLGFSTASVMLAELDPTVYFLSRSAWEPKLTARQSHDDLFTTITGKQSISDRLWLGFGHIEKATELIDHHDQGFSLPDSNLLMKHHQPSPLPTWWDELNEAYSAAMVEFYRSHSGADPRSRNLLYYWAKRSEYVMSYLASVKALRNSAIAKSEGDMDLALEQMESAVEEMYNAIDTLGDVALDSSDRGLIAVLNAHAFKPLMAAYEKLLDEE